MISQKVVIFTARRVCIARTMPSLYVCPSVSLCHTPDASIVSKWLYISSNSFHHRVATILVFPHQTGWKYSDGDPLTGASNARGYEKITMFDQYLALSRK